MQQKHIPVRRLKNWLRSIHWQEPFSSQNKLWRRYNSWPQIFEEGEDILYFARRQGCNQQVKVTHTLISPFLTCREPQSSFNSNWTGCLIRYWVQLSLEAFRSLDWMTIHPMRDVVRSLGSNGRLGKWLKIFFYLEIISHLTARIKIPWRTPFPLFPRFTYR